MGLIRTISIALALLLSTPFYANTTDSTSTTSERDVLVSLTAKAYDSCLYFNLTMINESKPGIYSLVKVFDDGSFKSVGMKEITINTLNQPLLYSFKDHPLVDKPYSYVLVRISVETEVLKTWYCSYCPDTENGFCIDEAKFAKDLSVANL